jgi:hypothetical protein
MEAEGCKVRCYAPHFQNWVRDMKYLVLDSFKDKETDYPLEAVEEV